MSILAKNLVASETERRFADVPSMSTLTVQNAISEMLDSTIYEYRIEARLGATTLVKKAFAECAKHSSTIFSDAIRATRRKIVEEVFGEFRPLIYQINESIHSRDWCEANRLTEKLYQQMFEDGL